jgi:hypothetical protein
MTGSNVSVSGLLLNFIAFDRALTEQHRVEEALISAGCTRVETCVFDDSGEFPSHEAYWHAFDGRQGSTFDYLSRLTDEQRLSLKASLLSSMNADGPVKLKIRALAVKGRRK